MSFYPDVSPGDPFKPNVRLSNDVRHLVNAAHGFQDCRQKSVPFGSVRVSVYNASTVNIPINSAVVFTTDALHGDVLPVRKAPAGTTEFGIIQKTLAPNECGSCLLIGIATVTLGSGTGDFVKTSSTKAFTRASSGAAKILYSTGTTAVVLLGGSQAGRQDIGALPDGGGRKRSHAGSIIRRRRRAAYHAAPRSAGSACPAPGGWVQSA